MYEYNIGVRDHYEYTEALFPNSLFKDYLVDNGLKTWHDESTRDIICLEFNYGTRSYKQELEHLYNVAKSAKIEYDKARISRNHYLMKKAKDKRDKITELLDVARQNRKKYHCLSKEQLRDKFYNDGVNVEYITKDRNGNIIRQEIIHYKMLFRSTGKAKKGSCMFICDRLYKRAVKFLRMGIKLPKDNPPIVEISAYSPLVASGIVGKIKINPRNILILKDVDRYFKTNVVSIEIDENKQCQAVHKDNYELKNTLFDGQALIDSSLFPPWANGYILLRHHFCKMAAFSTNIQQFFKDYFGDRYETATVTDMFGNEHFVKDIELITTDNAVKWTKSEFNISYDYWCDRVNENDCMFGIVKTAHESKLGEVQKMSYQMVNSLDESIMDNVVRKSVEYISRLKQDDDFFLEYLKKNSNFSNDYEVLIALCKQNDDFKRSEYFRDRKKNIIKSYVYKFKSGEVINEAENLTIVGSPYAMLLYAAGGNQEDVDKDDTFYFEQGTIQCYTERFNSGEYLAFFRSPFNSKNNLTYLHNVYSKKIEKYFNLGKQCIAVNMIGTDFQDRDNGSDQDSDFGYTTNHPDIVGHAKQCYLHYPTIVNNVPKEKNTYNNTMSDFARMDNNLAKSQTDIGESSNFAQLAQSYACSFNDSKYDDYVCILSTLAQIAIDNSKRCYDINIMTEIKRIKAEMNIKENLYPSFWSGIKKGFSKKNINHNLHCPMNYLYDLDLNKFRNSTPTLPMSYFFVKQNLKIGKKSCKIVEDVIDEYNLKIYNSHSCSEMETEDYLLLRKDFDALIESLKRVKLSRNYIGLISWLIDRSFLITNYTKAKSNSIKSNIGKNKSILLKILYTLNPQAVLDCFSGGLDKLHKKNSV